jgi:hypothetical protein
MKTAIFAFLIFSGLGIGLFFQYQKQTQTLTNGVPVTVTITKVNCNSISRRTAKIEFSFAGKLSTTAIHRKACDTLSPGDQFNLLYYKQTDSFIDPAKKTNRMLWASFISFAVSLYALVYYFVLRKKQDHK